jgi:hypothetical protein
MIKAMTKAFIAGVVQTPENPGLIAGLIGAGLLAIYPLCGIRRSGGLVDMVSLTVVHQN